MSFHILFHSDNAPVGGVHQYNHSIICGLATEGYKVTSVQLEQSNPLVERQKELGVTQIWLGAEFLSGYSRSFTDLGTPREVISQAQPDLIIFSDGWPLGNFAAKQVALELKIPYIVVVGFVDPSCAAVDRGSGFSYTDAAHCHYTMAEAAVAVSHENLDLLHTLFKVPEERSQVIHYGRPQKFFNSPNIDTRKRVRQELNVPDDAIVCFTSARFAFVKGYDLQIEMIKELKNSSVWEKLHFLWAGGGIRGETVELEIRQQVSALGVEGKVHFLGERQDIPDLLETSDIYLLPSRAEGMPLAIMEAMAKGLPVIASAVSGIPEELADTGKLLPDPKNDPEATIRAMVTTVEQWSSDSKLRTAVGSACKRRAEMCFKEERMVDQYLKIVRYALTARSSKTSKISAITLNQAEVDRLFKSISYACLVWDAWDKHSIEDLQQMQALLSRSLALTPFLRFETITNWMEAFTKFYREKGEKFSAYELCNSDNWQSLVREQFVGAYILS